MREATSIEFIENLAQYNYNGEFYDFHNDFDFEKLVYSNEVLCISFKSITAGNIVMLQFEKVLITVMDFYFRGSGGEKLTLDSLYRGRLESGGELISESDGRGYFYMEFYEGQKLEFWAKNLIVKGGQL